MSNLIQQEHTMHIIKKIGFLALAVIAFRANAQTDKATTARIVNEKNYIFVATSAIPVNSAAVNDILLKMPGNGGGGVVNLAGNGYDVRLNKDSLIAYLPYYGRSYIAPVSNDDNGYKFTATDFTYDEVKTKKGWDISIRTKDVRDNTRLQLSISEKGYASLTITSNSRQSITYNGYLSEVKPKKN